MWQKHLIAQTHTTKVGSKEKQWADFNVLLLSASPSLRMITRALCNGYGWGYMSISWLVGSEPTWTEIDPLYSGQNQDRNSEITVYFWNRRECDIVEIAILTGDGMRFSALSSLTCHWILAMWQVLANGLEAIKSGGSCPHAFFPLCSSMLKWQPQKTVERSYWYLNKSVEQGSSPGDAHEQAINLWCAKLLEFGGLHVTVATLSCLD